MDCMAQPFVYKPIMAMTAIKFLVFDNSASSTLWEPLVPTHPRPSGRVSIPTYLSELSAAFVGTFLLDGCGITEFQYTVQTMLNMLGAWATNAIYKR